MITLICYFLFYAVIKNIYRKQVFQLICYNLDAIDIL